MRLKIICLQQKVNKHPKFNINFDILHQLENFEYDMNHTIVEENNSQSDLSEVSSLEILELEDTTETEEDESADSTKEEDSANSSTLSSTSSKKSKSSGYCLHFFILRFLSRSKIT